MNSTPEQMKPEFDWSTAGERAWSSCHRVANSALALNNPRTKLSMSVSQQTAIAYRTHGSMGQQDSSIGSAAPKRSGNAPHLKGGPTGTNLTIVQPEMHIGALNPGVNSDFRDIPTSMGEVVQSQSAHNLNRTIEDIAKL